MQASFRGFTYNNLVAVVSSRGEVVITVNEGKTTSQTFLFFITKLVSHFDEADPGWRAQTVIMLDNAAYHRS